MRVKPDLSLDFCTHAVVSSTPYPSYYAEGTAATTTLFDLGIVDGVQQAHFVNNIKSRIFPWLIDNADVASSPDITVQISAASVMNHAK
jgi:hypothetical protein